MRKIRIHLPKYVELELAWHGGNILTVEEFAELSEKNQAELMDDMLRLSPHSFIKAVKNNKDNPKLISKLESVGIAPEKKKKRGRPRKSTL